MSIRHLTFVQAALTLALLTLPPVATAQTVRYVVVPLAKPAPQAACVPTAITQQRDVVGTCNTGGVESAVVWRNGVVTPLGTLPDGVFSRALAINAAGSIVGEGDDGDLIGKAIIHRNGQWIEIDGSGGSYQAAMGITDAGVVFGRYSSTGHPGTETMDPVYWVFDADHDRYDRFALSKAPGTPSTGFSGADVWAASRFGIAVGGVTTDLIGNRGAIWMNDAAHTLVLLSVPADRSSALASGVSDDGRTVGWAFGPFVPPASPIDRAVLWMNDADHTLVDIGTLPGDAWSRAFGVNIAGQVVGASYQAATVPRGFLFEHGTLTELTTLLDDVSVGWTIAEAAGIANDGVIIATGRLNGEFHPVMLVPSAAPDDTTPPEIALNSPAAGTVSGQVTIAADATDNVGVTQVVFLADGQAIGQSAGPSYTLLWDTVSVPDGPVSLTARAFDAAGNEAESAAVAVTIANNADGTPPNITAPGTIVAEAAGPNGAAVSFTVFANDAVDGDVPVSCTPVSGSTFPLGPTTVTCMAADKAGNQASASFSVVVQDKTAPVVSVPAAITQEATGASGAAVAYTASASDAVDGAIGVSCNPSSGSMFPLGSTLVSCTATDAAGNQGSGSFSITVQDKTAPAITVPSPITVQSSAPIAVTYVVSATDIVDGAVPVICTPASGSIFPLGSTTVSCSATDGHGNQATASFAVNVQSPPSVIDKEPPVLLLPPTIRTKARPGGRRIYYVALAFDKVDGRVPVSCTPPSGSLFFKGKTTVSCKATDSAGNTARGSFIVHLTGSGKK